MTTADASELPTNSCDNDECIVLDDISSEAEKLLRGLHNLIEAGNRAKGRWNESGYIRGAAVAGPGDKPHR